MEALLQLMHRGTFMLTIHVERQLRIRIVQQTLLFAQSTTVYIQWEQMHYIKVEETEVFLLLSGTAIFATTQLTEDSPASITFVTMI